MHWADMKGSHRSPSSQASTKNRLYCPERIQAGRGVDIVLKDLENGLEPKPGHDEQLLSERYPRSGTAPRRVLDGLTLESSEGT